MPTAPFATNCATPLASRRRGLPPLLGGVALSLVLAGCQSMPFDLDLRNRSDGFTTATGTVPDRPRPDSRGLISYPGYQVVVAQQNDTVAGIASRLGLDAASVASYNGLTPDMVLRRDEIVALPGRVAEPSPATGAATTGPIRPAPVPAAAPAPAAAPGGIAVTPLASAPAAPQTGAEPIRHQVAQGETIYSISRTYDVPARAIADWNGLDPALEVRVGQQLLIPQGIAAPAAPAPANPEPGAGSVTPVPPSAAAPLPDEETQAPAAAAATAEAATPPEPPVASPDLGSQQAEPAAAQMVRPTEGAIIRDYAQGRNEGIDIGAAAGSPVRAADAGTVAAITTNTDGVQIVVIRHAGELLTVYTHVDALSVARGDRVTRGQQIGAVRAGNPSFLHFEVRNGMESRDPTDFLP